MYTLKKKLFDAKGPFADNVIKNPARYIFTWTARKALNAIIAKNKLEFNLLCQF